MGPNKENGPAYLFAKLGNYLLALLVCSAPLLCPPCVSFSCQLTQQKKDSFILFENRIFLLKFGILVLLILRNEVVHVWFGLSELHLVHSFTCVPMYEGFSLEHCIELFCDSFEHFLDRGWISYESDCHLQSLRWNVANWGFDVIRDPLDEISRVFVLKVKHLFVNFFGRHSSSEDSGDG